MSSRCRSSGCASPPSACCSGSWWDATTTSGTRSRSAPPPALSGVCFAAGADGGRLPAVLQPGVAHGGPDRLGRRDSGAESPASGQQQPLPVAAVGRGEQPRQRRPGARPRAIGDGLAAPPTSSSPSASRWPRTAWRHPTKRPTGRTRRLARSLLDTSTGGAGTDAASYPSTGDLLTRRGRPPCRWETEGPFWRDSRRATGDPSPTWCTNRRRWTGGPDIRRCSSSTKRFAAPRCRQHRESARMDLGSEARRGSGTRYAVVSSTGASRSPSTGTATAPRLCAYMFIDRTRGPMVFRQSL